MSRQNRCLLLAFVGIGILAAKVHAEEDWTAEWLFKAAPEGAVAVHGRQRIWRDPKRHLVILDGEVCLREGQLEMFACPRETKEHESVVVVDALPGIVHGELVKAGAKPGSPVEFDPYRPATGTTIRVMVLWVDKGGKRRAVPAQQWVKNHNTGTAMERGWVFAGSRFVRDENTRRRMYLADGGDFICVANFATAALDLPVKSTQENAGLLYEAFTENVPPLKTKVRLVLIPEVER